MKSRLEQIFDRYLQGRAIAVWGQPSRLLQRELKPYAHHLAECVDRQKHYVVAPTEEDLEDFLQDEMSRNFKDVEDYICFSDKGKELPFDWEYCGAQIGKQTYFGEGVVNACQNGYIQKIGRYTSINSSAMIHVDHHANMCFISDEVKRCFSKENKALFRQRYLEDPGRPYAANKEKLIIGNDVWIGAHAFINCSKVTHIGDGAVIGSGAVVLEDVPPYSVVVGVPGKVKKYRYAPELIALLQRVKWWEWDEEIINANADALMNPEIFMKRFG